MGLQVSNQLIEVVLSMTKCMLLVLDLKLGGLILYVGCLTTKFGLPFNSVWLLLSKTYIPPKQIQ